MFKLTFRKTEMKVGNQKKYLNKCIFKQQITMTKLY